MLQFLPNQQSPLVASVSSSRSRARRARSAIAIAGIASFAATFHTFTLDFLTACGGGFGYRYPKQPCNTASADNYVWCVTQWSAATVASVSSSRSRVRRARSAIAIAGILSFAATFYTFTLDFLAACGGGFGYRYPKQLGTSSCHSAGLGSVLQPVYLPLQPISVFGKPFPEYAVLPCALLSRSFYIRVRPIACHCSLALCA